MAQLSHITVCTLLLALATLPSLVATATDQLSVTSIPILWQHVSSRQPSQPSGPASPARTLHLVPHQLRAGYQKAKGDCTFMFGSGILKILRMDNYVASTITITKHF